MATLYNEDEFQRKVQEALKDPDPEMAHRKIDLIAMDTQLEILKNGFRNISEALSGYNTQAASHNDPTPKKDRDVDTRPIEHIEKKQPDSEEDKECGTLLSLLPVWLLGILGL